VSDPYEILESGRIFTLAGPPFPVAEDDRAFLLAMRAEEIGHHKNIAYRPLSGHVSGVGKLDETGIERLGSILRAYSRWAIETAGELLPRYRDSWRLDYASLRPLEEAGRELPWKKRNDLLHTDAFPTRPTNGDLILRMFTNVHPSQPRVWVVSDPFETIAPRWATAARLAEFSRGNALRGFKRGLRALGLPVVVRSPYDEFMLAFHDDLKRSAEYQSTCPKYEFTFPPGATWLVFTDIVPHSVISGRLALEQTFLVARETLASRARAPISILEKLAGARLSTQ
jgi:3-deoxy-D-manno-oct-2-ulosonic acid (Kdo) hydroxylase